ncbi:MAG: phosphatidylserine decarboxylase [Candidatus Pacebacteria bacterium]|nr:phosphatidylserine decarboxylase [Candidatus Paceibacterota bacterium]
MHVFRQQARQPPVTVYDRKTGDMFDEPILGDHLLRLTCRNYLGALPRLALFRSHCISRVLGWYADSRWSRHAVNSAIRQLHIDVSEFAQPVEQYRTFNEFFTRCLRKGTRPYNPAPNEFCAPADSRVLVFPSVDALSCFPVKGVRFNISRLLKGADNETTDIHGGSVAVFRLSPADCHRFYYPASGRVLTERQIPGGLAPVNIMALRRRADVYTSNTRYVSMVEFDGFGRAAFVEVGAFAVGRIVHTHNDRTFTKMDEKGYFEFGGSTIVVVLRPGCIEFDADLAQNTLNGYETRILAGQRVGCLFAPDRA